MSVGIQRDMPKVNDLLWSVFYFDFLQDICQFTNFLKRQDTFFLSMPFDNLHYYATPCKVSSKSEHVYL